MPTFDLGMWKTGVVMGLLSAAILFLTLMMTFKTPPTAWEFIQVAALPALLNFVTTIYQKMCGPTKLTDVK